MKMPAKNIALLIVDVQKGLDDPKLGMRNNPQAEENMAKLLAFWRHENRPIFHIQHLSTNPRSTLRPNQVGCEIKEVVKPLSHECVIQKQTNSAFVGTNLQALLDEEGIRQMVVVGLTTNHCVSATTRMASDLGYEVMVVADATAVFDLRGYDGKTYEAEDIHAISLVNLHQEFATVLDTEDLLVSC